MHSYHGLYLPHDDRRFVYTINNLYAVHIYYNDLNIIRIAFVDLCRDQIHYNFSLEEFSHKIYEYLFQ